MEATAIHCMKYSMMASQLKELDGKSFLSNSDAHSLIKMGREYNVFEVVSWVE